MATRPSPPQRARERERELVRVTRALFDERGMQDAPVEEIARAAGIARGLVYRSFSSKEELFVLAVTDYLAELAEALEASTADETDPVACLYRIAAILRAGAEAGVFTVEDPDYTANVLWTQGLGAMHLARIRVGVRSIAPGIPALFAVEPEQIVRTCVASALANVGAAGA